MLGYAGFKQLVGISSQPPISLSCSPGLIHSQFLLGVVEEGHICGCRSLAAIQMDSMYGQ